MYIHVHAHTTKVIGHYVAHMWTRTVHHDIDSKYLHLCNSSQYTVLRWPVQKWQHTYMYVYIWTWISSIRMYVCTCIPAPTPSTQFKWSQMQPSSPGYAGVSEANRARVLPATLLLQTLLQATSQQLSALPTLTNPQKLVDSTMWRRENLSPMHGS